LRPPTTMDAKSVRAVATPFSPCFGEAESKRTRPWIGCVSEIATWTSITLDRT
jgi:hypothetical protein